MTGFLNIFLLVEFPFLVFKFSLVIGATEDFSPFHMKPLGMMIMRSLSNSGAILPKCILKNVINKINTKLAKSLVLFSDFLLAYFE